MSRLLPADRKEYAIHSCASVYQSAAVCGLSGSIAYVDICTPDTEGHNEWDASAGGLAARTRLERSGLSAMAYSSHSRRHLPRRRSAHLCADVHRFRFVDSHPQSSDV